MRDHTYVPNDWLDGLNIRVRRAMMTAGISTPEELAASTIRFELLEDVGQRTAEKIYLLKRDLESGRDARVARVLKAAKDWRIAYETFSKDDSYRNAFPYSEAKRDLVAALDALDD